MSLFEPASKNVIHPKRVIKLDASDYAQIYGRPLDMTKRAGGYMCYTCDQWGEVIYAIAENKEEARWQLRISASCSGCMIQKLVETGANIKFEYEIG